VPTGFATHARVSPDGRWVAYASNESGRFEIFLRNFQKPVGNRQISTGGGIQPVWRRDGKELFYIAPGGKLMSVALKLGDDGETSAPVELFQTRMAGVGSPTSGLSQQYDVTPDGQRFLVNTAVEQATLAPVTVVVNWTAGLK
jgi:hypothetical protein